MHIPLEMLPQPTESTCGPTCLHAIYRHFRTDIALDQLVSEIPEHEDGGTLSVNLALHALSRGFEARTYSYNLRVFDPTWWNLEPEEMIDKLTRRIPYLESEKLIQTHQLYIKFLQRGGRLKFNDLTPNLLNRLLQRGFPILTGLSATYLYQHVRELSDSTDDDIAGFPTGHFVVVNGFDADTLEVTVTDPYLDNPFNPKGIYRVDVHRFINAVMLGIVTYDANLLIITPKTSPATGFDRLSLER
jgi:hypothetical protein